MKSIACNCLFVAGVAVAAIATGYVLSVLTRAEPAPALHVHAEPLRDYEGRSFHGDTDAHPVEALGRAFPKRSIPYWIDRASLGDGPIDTVSRCFSTAFRSWSEVLDIEPVETSDRSAALIRMRFGPIDGPLGALASSGLSDGTGRPVDQTYDAAETWADNPTEGHLSLIVTACHEIGHALGLGHDDATADSILRPTYTARITRPRERDFARAVTIGYKRRAPAPEVMLTFPVSARASDIAQSLRGAGWIITQPLKE